MSPNHDKERQPGEEEARDSHTHWILFPIAPRSQLLTVNKPDFDFYVRARADHNVADLIKR